MQNLNRYVSITAVASEITHLFCCGLPMLFSILSFFSSLGLMASMPTPLEYIHEALHGFEIPLITISATLIIAGWALYFVSKRINCLKDGNCEHKPCSPKKAKSNKILVVATFLFIFNLTGYIVLHH